MEKPICMDEATTKHSRIDFAHCREEITAEMNLLEEAWVKIREPNEVGVFGLE